MKSRDRRLRKETGKVKGKSRVKSRDRSLRKDTGEVKGQKIEERDG